MAGYKKCISCWGVIVDDAEEGHAGRRGVKNKFCILCRPRPVGKGCLDIDINCIDGGEN